jgi:hypothetical protein
MSKHRKKNTKKKKKYFRRAGKNSLRQTSASLSVIKKYSKQQNLTGDKI